MSPVLLALRISSSLALGIALAIAVYTVLSAPSRIASRFGMRGLRRQREIARNPNWASFEPFVRWLGVRAGRLLTDETAASIDALIGQAGDFMGLTPDEFLALSILTSIGGGVVGALAGVYFAVAVPLCAILGIAFGAAAPYLHISGIATERLRSIGRGLPYTVDLMALSMGAGLDFPGAVRQVVEKSSNPDDPILEEFILLLQSLSLGRTRRDALLEFARRAPVDTVKEFVNSLVQAEERGNPVAEVLSIQANVSRQRRSTRGEEAAAKAGVQLMLPLTLIFLAVLALMIGPGALSLKGGGLE
jgi:tight adherence protein C